MSHRPTISSQRPPLPTGYANLKRSDDVCSPHHHPQVDLPSPWLEYGLALAPLVVILMAFGFFMTLSASGALTSPHRLGEMVIDNPRLSAQVVTVLGSFLTSAVRFGLSRVFRLVAQKRFLKFRTIYESEVWAAFKNGGIIWTWKHNKGRWLMTAASAVVVVLCGLLTSGFVSLLSPLPVLVTKSVFGDPQLDYTMENPACLSWLELVVSRASTHGGKWRSYKDFRFQTCETLNQLYEVLEAGRAGMFVHILSSQSSKEPQRFVSTYGRLGNTRILGTTGGVLPIGPSGITAFPIRSALSDPDFALTNGHLNANASYSLTSQGIWCDVSCQYVDQSELPFTFPFQDVGSAFNTTFRCPGGEPTLHSFPKSDNVLLLDYCPSSTKGTWNYYLYSSFSLNLPSPTANDTFAGIGSMKCAVTPKFQMVEATYDARIGAFTMKPQARAPPLGQLPRVVLDHANRYVARTIKYAQTQGRGNLAGSLLDNIAVSRHGLPGMTKDEKYEGLVASMIKGIYEYQATHLRLILTLAPNSTMPVECQSNTAITGTATFPVIGWDAKPYTFVSLMPHAAIAIMMLYLTLWVIGSEEKLKVFDPTSTVSLIATSSIGNIRFDAEVVGDPEDEEVRRTRIKYGSFKDPQGVERWGMIQEDGPSDTAIAERKPNNGHQV